MRKKEVIAYVPIHMLIGICVLFASCSRDKTGQQEANEDSVLLDTCNFCILDSFLVKPMASVLDVRLVIDRPVAIIFFNRYNLIGKYHKEETYDTLVKLLGMKHAYDRNVIYELTEQSFYFNKEVRPTLVKNAVDIIDTIRTSGVVEFHGTTKSFQVNVLNYKNQDGVLLYQPGKKPIFWTLQREQAYCKDFFVLVKQYFECSQSRIDE